MFLVSNIAQNQNSIEQDSFLVIFPTEFIFFCKGDHQNFYFDFELSYIRMKFWSQVCDIRVKDFVFSSINRYCPLPAES